MRACAYPFANFSWSLYKLRLKFVQTTRVVCTDFAEVLTLGKVGAIFSSLMELFQCASMRRLSKAKWDRCIVWHSLRYFRHSGPVTPLQSDIPLFHERHLGYLWICCGKPFPRYSKGVSGHTWIQCEEYVEYGTILLWISIKWNSATIGRRNQLDKTYRYSDQV